jgi:hypothetical protein
MVADTALNRLEDTLAGDLSWRKKEIIAFRGSIARRSSTQKHFSRAGLVLLCAHWEGFLKKAVQAYVDFVFCQGIPLRKLSSKFIAISIFKDVKHAAEADYPGSELHCVRLARRMLDSLEGATSKAGWKVDTHGNASSTVTMQILSTVGLNEKLGLDDAEWFVVKAFIDEQLLKIRHKIAHGEGFPVDASDFYEKSRRVMSLFDSLHSLIMSAAVSKSYLIN